MPDVIGLVLDATGIERVARQMQQFADTQIATGSGAGMAAGLLGMNGLTGADVGGMSRAAYQKSLSGMGLIANLQAGNPLQFDELQPVDYGKRLVNLVTELVRIGEKNYEEARLFAKRTDTEPFLKLFLLSKGEREGALARMNGGPGGLSGFAHGQATFMNSKDNFFDTMVKGLSGPGTIVAYLGSLLLDAVSWVANHTAIGIMRSLWEAMYKNAAGPGSNAHTNALNQLTDELRKTREGIFGGGRRARTAIPAGFGIGWGGFLPDAMRSHTVRLGAYAISM